MLSVKLQSAAGTGKAAWWKEGILFKVRFIITPTNVNTGANANPYVLGGDTLDLTQLFSLASSAPGLNLPTLEIPSLVSIISARLAGGASSGNKFDYSFAPGTTLANGTMQIFTGAAAQTALTELNAGNYPAGVLNDVILATAEFFMP